MRLLIATTNAHKAEELRVLLADRNIDIETLAEHPIIPEPPETGDTFVENALQKARWVFGRTNRLTLADDSGLEVDALDGRPGVRSRRFSPEATHAANNALLLKKLGDRPDRRARFRCVLAAVSAEGEAWVEGTCEGAIALSPRGIDGFGYDPLFLPDEAPGLTMAELSMNEKNAISHRGRALSLLDDLLTRVGAR
jgi:XTP/dITP diphosphohydrolase